MAKSEKQNNEQKEQKEKTKRGTPRERKAIASHTSTSRLKNWREVYATMEDIKDFLREHVMLRYNVISGRTEVHVIEQEPAPPDPLAATAEDYTRWLREWQADTERPRPSAGDDGYWVPLTDRIENTLYTRMKARREVRMQDLLCVIHSDFVPEYHPFRQYLDALPRWREGQPDYIMELSLTVNVRGGTDEQLLFYEYLRKWLVSMVAGWVSPQVVNNTMLVLIGEQGSYKTTWFNYLLPPELRPYFYTKTNAGRMTKDDLLTLSQYGLVCCEELDTMRPSELNQLKAAMTMPSVDERAAYARHKEHREHIASFCGTGNSVQFLSDVTGNRRWLPFEVESIESPRSSPFPYEGIYAQAYALYRRGFRYWFSPEEIRRLARHNEQYEAPCTERELVFWFFRRPEAGERGEFMPVGLAMQIVSGQISAKISKEQMGHAFIALGFERKTYRNVRGYIVVRRSAAEIENLRKGLASGDTHTPDTPVF